MYIGSWLQVFYPNVGWIRPYVIMAGTGFVIHALNT